MQCRLIAKEIQEALSQAIQGSRRGLITIRQNINLDALPAFRAQQLEIVRLIEREREGFRSFVS